MSVASTRVRLGMTLPSFNEDAEVLLASARAADAAGLDGVFLFDHLFRRSPSGELRPSLEMTAAIGAIATETKHVTFGPLVARTTIRPPAVLAVELDTLARIAPGRMVVTLGAGDRESEAEQTAFGLMVGTPDDRVQALVDSVKETVGRGYPVWVGGLHEAVREVAVSMADGWNSWGSTHEQFAAHVRWVGERRAALAGAEIAGAGAAAATAVSDFTCSWGGLALLGATEADARRKREGLGERDWDAVVHGGPERVAEQLRRFRNAGAGWIILGMLDPNDRENSSILAERVAPLLE